MSEASSRVLVLAAHPDDEVLGMGGTIAVHTARGDAVRIVCVTDGSSTQYPGDAATRAQKEEEATRAAEELGVTDYVHLDLPDMRLDTLPHVEVNRVVEEQVREFAPSAVYTPQPDVNLDHRVLFESVAVATRPTPGQGVRRVLTYAPTSSTEWTPAAHNWFLPNWFVDVTETLERKVAAFAHYATEQRSYPHPRSERAIRATAEFYGASCGCEYAEPFVLVRSLEPS
jgi:N-acetylglucosamine malate deacetylase 1